MRPIHFDEGLVKRYHLFGEDEESGKFGSSGRRYDELDDFCDVKAGAVVSGDRIILGEHDVVTGEDA